MSGWLLPLAVLIVVAAAVGVGWGRRRRLANERRVVRDERRRAQQEVWNRHMAGKPSGPGHNSSLV